MNPIVSLTPARLAALLALAVTSGCSSGNSTDVIWGPTMGTHYSVQFDRPLDEDRLQRVERQIADELAAIDRQMSGWRPDSEVSLFNSQTGTDWFAVSGPTAEVVAGALVVAADTDGAFDITVEPLLDLWGFGPSAPARVLPKDEEIAARLGHVGWRNLEVRMDPPALRKKLPLLRIDLSALAKGYAVDRLTRVLEQSGVQNYLVEIGGEICTRGVNASQQPWTVAIESPGPKVSDVPVLLRPGYKCVATSGDYRNFFLVDGIRYSHVIDPRTGKPADGGLASVTVVADSAMEADAWATALLINNSGDGLRLANKNHIAALLISRGKSGANPGFRQYRSDQLAPYEFSF